MSLTVQRNVCLMSADAHQAMRRGNLWFERMQSIPLRWRCGGRCGTIRLTLEQFAKRIGDPHEAAPQEQWRKYKTHGLIHGDGKISALWHFETPRGPVEVSDYWWNAKDELSVRAPDVRAVRWFRRWCKEHDIPMA